MNKPIIEVSQFSFSYPTSPSNPVLQNLTFSIEPSKITAIIGPNGSGKSTLFKILSTIQPITHTRKVFAFGLDIATSPNQIRPKIGVLFQNPSLDPYLTAYENLLCAALLAGISGKHIKSQINLSLASVGLLQDAKTLASRLSGGQQRKLEIARCLLTSPPLLILDEPSSGLDPNARADLWQVYRSLTENGTTIILITHLMDEAEKADSIILLNHGQIAAAGNPLNLIQKFGPFILTASFSDPTTAEKAVIHLKNFPNSTILMRSTSIIASLSTPHIVASSLHDIFPNSLLSTSIHKPTLNDVFTFITYPTQQSPTNNQLSSHHNEN
ncbi:MAG: ABC transporter ATP-binding protein [Chthoniobacterales bacterium]|nr:ABC transporter ATP-binding protein [Chthoniobacterales bacterium]